MIEQECITSAGWVTVKVQSNSSPGVSYDVLIPPWDRDTKEGAVCGCDGFRYRGECSHIAKAHDEICNWSTGHGKKQTKQQELRRICPECGSRTRITDTDTEA